MLLPRNDSVVGADGDEKQDKPEGNHHTGPVRVADQLDPRDGGVVEHGGGRDVDDGEHHRHDLHTDQTGGDHELGGGRHEPRPVCEHLLDGQDPRYPVGLGGQGSVDQGYGGSGQDSR